MPKKNKIVIWGASGHASVIADILKLKKKYEIVGFLDDINKSLYGNDFCGIKIIGGREKLKTLYNDGVRLIIIGIGDCHIRANLASIALKEGFSLANAIHPDAIVAENVKLGNGIAIMAGAVINPGSIIGDNVIVNTCASIDHDCIIGDNVHICPGVHLAGSVKIGMKTWIGIGSVVIQKIKIGKETMLGAGSVVVNDIPDNVTAFGVPAKIITKK